MVVYSSVCRRNRLLHKKISVLFPHPLSPKDSGNEKLLLVARRVVKILRCFFVGLLSHIYRTKIFSRFPENNTYILVLVRNFGIINILYEEKLLPVASSCALYLDAHSFFLTHVNFSSCKYIPSNVFVTLIHIYYKVLRLITLLCLNNVSH